MSVDGNDVLAVRAATEEAVDRARAGEGPSLIECKTYRWHGHYEGDPQRYRDKEEVAAWREKDPLARLMSAVQADSDLTEELNALADRAVREVAAAVDAARASEPPDPRFIGADVYRQPEVFANTSAGARLMLLEATQS